MILKHIDKAVSFLNALLNLSYRNDIPLQNWSNAITQIFLLLSRLAMRLHYGDMTDSSCLVKLLMEIQPTEIYNLAAQSHVKVSFDLAEYTANVDALGVLRLLDALRTCGLDKKVKFYQASTSELYGKVQEVPQKETTPFYPRSPYGVLTTGSLIADGFYLC